MVLVAEGYAAVAAGEWRSARDAFERALVLGDSPEPMFGLAMSLFWLGNPSASDRIGRSETKWGKAWQRRSKAKSRPSGLDSAGLS